MRRSLELLIAVCLVAAHASAQEFVPTPAPELLQTTPAATPQTPQTVQSSPQPKPQKRGWFSRVLHPFGGSSKRSVPDYKDPKLRGLALDLQISPETIRLSETRQLEVKLTVTNLGKRTVELDFPNDQRIEIFLMNSAEIILTRWSDNHAVTAKPGSLLINPGEHVEYNETIATRDLAPNKVFVVEVLFPKYPELRTRQKFLTAP
ncbi:MAG: BsuPI-related putative proteinase inhibitor [Verrucomicrobiota bacterium]